MKKFVCFISVTVILLSAIPAFALFVNGGFETGDFSGWTLDYGVRSGTSISWGYLESQYGNSDIWNSSSTMSGQTANIDPFNGSNMALLNDSYGGWDATKISQTDTISQQDLDDGGTIYVNWGAALVEPSNYHPPEDQPFFGINVTVNGTTVDSFNANALQTMGWSTIGYQSGTIWYNQNTWSYDISSYAIGTSIGIEMFVADCDWGGHGGYAFLDGIGTIDPSNPVPEPSTVFLMGAGILGLLAINRKRLNKKS